MAPGTPGDADPSPGAAGEAAAINAAIASELDELAAVLEHGLRELAHVIRSDGPADRPRPPRDEPPRGS